MNRPLLKGVSIIICCYNSAKKLPMTLEHIANQKVNEDLNYEVIIVNNGSTDETLAVARNFKETTSGSVVYKIVEENIQGLCNARIKGVQTAKFDYILFCDDDVWLKESYVQKAFSIIESNSEIGVLGGRGEVVSDIRVPHWFATYQNSYAIGVQDIDSGDITSRGYLWGAGMILRNEVLLNLLQSGFKFYCSGRKEGKLLAGDDAEICKWFVLAGYQLWYDESLKFKHFMPEGRLTKTHLKGLHEGFRLSNEFLSKYDKAISISRTNITLKRKYLSALKVYISILIRPAASAGLRIRLQNLFPTNKKLVQDKILYEIYKSREKYIKQFKNTR